jgi:hypothetical protein
MEGISSLFLTTKKMMVVLRAAPVTHAIVTHAGVGLLVLPLSYIWLLEGAFISRGGSG